MKLKVFSLRDGKLEFKGNREVQVGDIIVEGQTSMAETVHLRESFAGPTREELQRARQELKAEAEAKARAALKASFKKMGLSDQAAEIAARGR